MKKLLIAAAIVCAAAMSQAGTVNWGGAACDADDWETDITGNWAYLIMGNADASLATTLMIDGNGADAIGGTADNGYTIVAAHQINADESMAGNFQGVFDRADADGGVNGYYQIILANSDNTKFAVAAIDSNPVAGILESTGAGEAYYNFNWDSGDQYIGDQGWTGAITGTPEPTSGLLLLIGMAGLALRRRRA